MSAKNQTFATYTTSVVGVVILAVIAIAVNLIAARLHVRADLTADKLYTLSSGTKDILKNTEAPVVIRFYATRSRNDMPVFLKNFSKRVEDLLTEYELASTNVRIEKLDPQPDTPAEEAAEMDGVQGQMIDSFSRVYLGIAVECLGEKEAIPFLNPRDEDNLEYDLTRMIYRVANPDPLKIGVMSSLPVMGGTPNMQNPMAPPPSQPWPFVNLLKQDYEVETVETDVDQIPEDINVLMLIHPKDLSEITEYALDQFVLRGGKLFAFVDPYSYDEAQNAGGNPMMAMQQKKSSDLPRLFKAWGVDYADDKILAERRYARGRAPQRQMLAPMYNGDDVLNRDDILTNSLERFNVLLAGTLSGSSPKHLERTVLLQSSQDAQLIDATKVQFGMPDLENTFDSGEKQLALAIRLTGKFKTAFPDGKPDDGEVDTDDGEETEDADGSHLAEAEKDSAVVIVADTDFLHQIMWGQEMQFFGRNVYQPIADNISFVQNGLEQLSGDNSLITIRSRGITQRPLEAIEKKRAEAEQEFQDKLQKIQEEIDESQKKLTELGGLKMDKQRRIILTPEQMEEIKTIEAKQKEAQKELREVRKRLRARIKSAQNKWVAFNLAGVPILVAVIGVSIAGIRHRRMTVK